MTDLSHWDFSESFTVLKADHLILGIEPENHGFLADKNQVFFEYRGPALPVIGRMARAYKSALSNLKDAAQYLADADPRFQEMEMDPLDLQSETLEAPWRERTFSSLGIFDDPELETSFSDQRFDRSEIARWLAEIGMQSAYQFEKIGGNQVDLENLETNAKSLANREKVTLLNIIGVMLELMKSLKLGRNSDAAVIKEMIENYPEKQGISKRTLEEKFAAANKSLKAE